MQKKRFLYILLAVLCFAALEKHYGVIHKLKAKLVHEVKYAKMKRDLKNQNIVVSFSTTPHRINKLQPMLDTLYNQNIAIDKIYISIPYTFKRDNLEYNIPQYLLDDPRITILRTEDYGPATKLLGALEQVSFPENTIIITVDDDIYYPRQLVLSLAHKAYTFPDSAIGVSGVDIDYDEHGNIRGPGQGIKGTRISDKEVMILLGYAGVAYRPKFFDNSIFDQKIAPHECNINDDLYISYYLAKNNIKRLNFRERYLTIKDIENNKDVGWRDDALFISTPNRAATNTICLEYMRGKDPHVIF